MSSQDPSRREFETSGDFAETFVFEIDGDIVKLVEVARHGKVFVVYIQYADIAIFEETRETFEADGAVKITVTSSGIYITSYRPMLSNRIRLRRTRFF
jgi:hypothetical protein